MPQGLLILPLLGGFLLLHLSHVFRFTAQRYDGNRLLLSSAVAGAVLLAMGRLVVLLVSALPGVNSLAENAWRAVSPFPHSDSCVWALVLGPLLARYVVNRMYDVEAAKNKLLHQSKQVDAFTRLLDIAIRGNRLVSITLANRKWYVGYVAEAPNLNPAERYFRLLPIVSGFRDKDTLETTRTTFYTDIADLSASADLVITLPIADVQSANFFDPDLYEQHFADEDA